MRQHELEFGDPERAAGPLPRSGTSMSRRDFVRTTVTGAFGAFILDSAGKALADSPTARFTFHAPQHQLDDLKRRLSYARWPERQTVSDWSQGVPEARQRIWMDYWRTAYDWRRCEATLNELDQYRATINGLGIHFLHVRSPHENALPLIISHGWPGSVLEFLKIIGPLTDPTAHGGAAEDAFHLVAPSLPGFAFSDKPATRGWNAHRIAATWVMLMERLGYRRYVAQGGDWGAFVTTAMAQRRPPGLIGIHLNFPQVIPDKIPPILSADEKSALQEMSSFQENHFGFFIEQETRPQTIGYALADSPVDWAAWLFDIFQAVTDNRGDPEDALTRDEMLNDITLYWLTNSAASSVRLYFEERSLGLGNNAGRVDLPVGCSIFPREIYRAPRSWARLMYPYLFYWNELDRGGHFAAWEQPALFARELRNCFDLLRKSFAT
ncbi:MAG: epoxide hydrolase family protein [Steroidobacteraceae bacterium]